MRITRLLLENPAAEGWATLEFHPALTVVAGLGGAGREAVMNELLGSLKGDAEGVHVEFRTDRGRPYSLVRSPKAPHMVLDTGRQEDVTDQFRTEDGSVDVLASLGIDQAIAKVQMQVEAQDLVHRGMDDRDLDQLARLDQTELWGAAERVRTTAAEAERAQQAVLDNAAKRDANDELSPEADEAYAAYSEISFEEAEGSHRTNAGLAGLATFLLVAGVAGYILAPSVLTMTAVFCAALLFLGAAARILAPIWRARAILAAVADAGESSLFALQLGRVDDMLAYNDIHKHQRLTERLHREAVAHWDDFVGIDIAWAESRRRDIEATVALLERSGEPAATATPAFSALVCRLSRPIATRSESMPLVMAEPFTDMTDSEKDAALELLVTTAGEAQRIVLTEDPAVIAWAKRALENGDHDLRLVAPTIVAA
ncbi:MAG: hypothetical protein HKN26_01200 [Acidimicrobiales bacterium]|nr:hypothetical protein [Acidimicrobiales bacterium]